MTGDLPSFLADAGVGAIHGFAGTMLVAAGASKFWSSDDFSPVVAAYDIVPAPLVLPFAAALPIAEMLFGILLILPGVPAVAFMPDERKIKVFRDVEDALMWRYGWETHQSMQAQRAEDEAA